MGVVVEHLHETQNYVDRVAGIDRLRPVGCVQSIGRAGSAVRLIFIHHSEGENWLSDDNGTLGLVLSNTNYFVSVWHTRRGGK